MRLATLQAQTEELISELEAFLAAIPEPAPDAGAIDASDLLPAPLRRHAPNVQGHTVDVPGGGNDFLAPGPEMWPFSGGSPVTGDSGGGTGGGW